MLQQKSPHLRGVGLTFRRLHHRTDDRTRGLNFAALDLLGNVWLIGQGLLDRREQRGVITNHHEPSGLNDGVDIAFAGDHTFEHLTRELVGQTAVGDQLLDPGDVAAVTGRSVKAIPCSLAIRVNSPVHHLRAAA